MINWTISVGTIVGAVPTVIFGLWYLFGTRGKTDTLGTDFAEMKDSFVKMQENISELATAVSTIAVAEEKIAAVNKRLDEEKDEGKEFRHWLRGEITRIWGVIATSSNDIKDTNQALGTVQGKVSAIMARVGGPDPD